MKENIAIVTGGLGDIGLAIVLKLVSKSIQTIIIDNNNSNQHKLDNLDYSLKKNIEIINSDVTDFSEAIKNINKINSKYKCVTILINCAGIKKDVTLLNMTEQDFDQVINVNLKGSFNYIKAIAPVFKDNNYGKIINITSINALRGKFGQANYTASKAGLIGLTKTAAIELGKYNVNVNAVAPGMIKTKMTDDLPDEIITKALNESVTGKLGTPEDIAELVYFLSSDLSKHITGQVIKIDGGQYL
ncbi:MAG: SDR family oxidoreductase [Cyanobacteriota bacterium]